MTVRRQDSGTGGDLLTGVCDEARIRLPPERSSGHDRSLRAPSSWLMRPSRGRVMAACLWIGCAILLAFGPDLLLEMGRLQNRWNGLPADPVVCSFRARTGLPCVGCGGTRALHLSAQGQFQAALVSNPLGAWAGFALWGGVVLGMASMVTGRWPDTRPVVVTVLTTGTAAVVVAFTVWWREMPATAWLR